MLAAAVVGTVIGILKYRKVSKAADNVNSLVNDGRKAANEIGEELNKVTKKIEDAMNNLEDIAENKKEISK